MIQDGEGGFIVGNTGLEQVQVRDWLPEMYRHFAEATLLSGDLDGAEAPAQKALKLARELSMRNEEGNSLRKALTVWRSVSDSNLAPSTTAGNGSLHDHSA